VPHLARIVCPESAATNWAGPGDRIKKAHRRHSFAHAGSPCRSTLVRYIYRASGSPLRSPGGLIVSEVPNRCQAG
jgi:hypothetical protein